MLNLIMALNDKQRNRLKALVKGLKEKKGVSIKQSEVLAGIKGYKEIQKEILTVKEKYKESPAVQKEADIQYQKLQAVIDDVNEYMKILHPEGLIDFGSGSSGKTLMGQG